MVRQKSSTNNKKKKSSVKKIRNKYKALAPYANPVKRREYIDYDYLTALSEDELKWLNKFSDEYYGGSFTKNKETGRYKGNIHTKTEDRRDCYRRNNRRMNCTYGDRKAKNTLMYSDVPEFYETHSKQCVNNEDIEDVIMSSVEFIDLFKKLKDIIVKKYFNFRAYWLSNTRKKFNTEKN